VRCDKKSFICHLPNGWKANNSQLTFSSALFSYDKDYEPLSLSDHYSFVHPRRLNERQARVLREPNAWTESFTNAGILSQDEAITPVVNIPKHGVGVQQKQD
jgi:hypothetical protein